MVYVVIAGGYSKGGYAKFAVLVPCPYPQHAGKDGLWGRWEHTPEDARKAYEEQGPRHLSWNHSKYLHRVLTLHCAECDARYKRLSLFRMPSR